MEAFVKEIIPKYLFLLVVSKGLLFFLTALQINLISLILMEHVMLDSISALDLMETMKC